MPTPILLKSKREIEKQFSSACGAPCELTFRTDTAFTLTFDEIEVEAAQKAVAYIKECGAVDIEVDHDEECGTAVYFQAPAEITK